VILHFDYEELTALKSGARTLLDRAGESAGQVLAPPESRARVEALLPRLEGDLTLSTLEELRGVQTAVVAIVDCLRAEMESAVVATHAADEGAVSAYFDFAHAFTVAHRVSELASEMQALMELMTGEPPTPEMAQSFHFPD